MCVQVLLCPARSVIPPVKANVHDSCILCVVNDDDGDCDCDGSDQMKLHLVFICC